MSDKVFNCPILFLIFNRPDTTQKVFNQIKKIKPKKLYIASDGPRQNNPDDIEKCKETIEIIDQIDWDCDIETLLREENLGCKKAISSAITWFFENEESGIILEDDCVPIDSFFWFCQELLDKYKYDEKVMMISGLNYFNNKLEMKESYFFSNYVIIWGWATWRRAWKKYNINMDGWIEFDNKKYLSYIYNNRKFEKWLYSLFKVAYENKVDAWGIQWYFSILINDGLCIVPKYNLVTNIGVEGAHVSEKSKIHFMPTKPLNVNGIIHPKLILLDYKYNNMLVNKVVQGFPNPKIRKLKDLFIRITRIPNKLKKLLINKQKNINFL